MAVKAARQRLSSGQRREQLMAAAVAVLADRGYGGATAELIARQAGTSKGLLWHYFTDLDDLFEQTARRTLTTLAEAVGASIDLTAPAPDVIRAAIHGAAELRRTHGAERRAMSEIILNLRTADGRLRLNQSDLNGLYAAQEAIFRRGQQSGHFRDTLDPRHLAVAYQGAVDSMLGYLDAYPDSDAEQLADTVAEVLLGGITKPTRRSKTATRPDRKGRSGLEVTSDPVSSTTHACRPPIDTPASSEGVRADVRLRPPRPEERIDT